MKAILYLLLLFIPATVFAQVKQTGPTNMYLEKDSLILVIQEFSISKTTPKVGCAKKNRDHAIGVFVNVLSSVIQDKQTYRPNLSSK